jgi:ubiquinone biosynthesis protein
VSSGRLSHVTGVLGQILLGETARALGIGRRSAGEEGDDAQRHRARAIRHALEELGPFYIKVGQMLSTRPDLMPDYMIEEFENLHEQVSVAGFETFEPILEEELGSTWRGEFKEIETDPLGAASLAQVYRVTLRTGESAVVKIQRPGVAPVMLDDMGLLRRAARLVAKRAPDLNDVIDIEATLESIFGAMEAELDFTVEARNMTDAAEVAEEFETLAVPEVVFATKKVLVQTMAPGKSIRAVNRDNFSADERAAIGRDLLRFMYEGYFTERVFHADPHPGNVFVEPGGKACIIDWGMVGRLDRGMSMTLALVIMNLAQNDGSGLAKAWIEMGRATSWANIPAFVGDMCRFVPTVANASMEELNFGTAMSQILKYSSRRGIQTSPVVGLLAKSFANIEGSVRYLAPEVSMTDVFTDSFQEIMFDLAQETISQEQAGKLTLEMLIGVNTAAEQVRTFARDLTNRELTVQFNEVQARRSRREDRDDARARALRRTLFGLGAVALWLDHRRKRLRDRSAPLSSAG